MASLSTSIINPHCSHSHSHSSGRPIITDHLKRVKKTTTTTRSRSSSCVGLINRSVRVHCQNRTDHQYEEPAEADRSDDVPIPNNKEKEKENPQETRPLLMTFLEKFGKSLREDLIRPQRKGGDWKDLTLMSLSFAVYVYMSQKMVCAYYAWFYMMPTKQH